MMVDSSSLMEMHERRWTVCNCACAVMSDELDWGHTVFGGFRSPRHAGAGDRGVGVAAAGVRRREERRTEFRRATARATRDGNDFMNDLATE